ncbi:MAG: alanine:cation symporter family protein, partial [Pseudomonadota bacterium]
FGWKEVFGGAAGYGVLAAVRAGIARGLFSNEAGQGSAPIAHAAAQTKNPVMQGEIAMIGVFIDTIVICTMTALVILTVTGDFEKSPSLMAANYCDDRGVVLPMNPDEEGTRFSVGDLVPSAYEDGRADKISSMGQTAQSYLTSCRAAGVTFDGLFEWSDAARGDLRAAKKAHAESAADGEFDVLSVDSAAAEEEAFYQSALMGTVDAAVTVKVDHAWETDANSAAITTRAYGAALPGGEWIVPIALFFFAFTTIIGWSYYGEQALTYLVGEWATHPFRYAWVLVVFAGTLVTNTDALWLLGDIANASMAFPNLIAILALSGVVIAMHKSNGEDEDAHVVIDKSQSDPSAE